MTTLPVTTRSTLTRRSTLVDHIVARSTITDALVVTAGAALTAGLAQVTVPLWPVPVTGQTLAVLLIAAALGARRGALSMTLYAVLGIIGVPVFSEASSGWHILAGPTGGYIIGFIVAAALTGWLAENTWDRTFIQSLLVFFGGTVVTFAFGLLWLSFTLTLNLQQTLESGLYPFLIGGLVKTVIAASIMTITWRVMPRK